jgi:hypothetical protein
MMSGGKITQQWMEFLCLFIKTSMCDFQQQQKQQQQHHHQKQALGKQKKKHTFKEPSTTYFHNYYQ